MSKTQNIIDAMLATGDTTQAERQLAKEHVTEGSKKLLREALAQVKTTGAPVKETTPVQAMADDAATKRRKLHTKARTAANAVKRAYFLRTGENFTYERACDYFGTAKAHSGSDVLNKRPGKTQAFIAQAIANPDAFVSEHLDDIRAFGVKASA